jgi:hypothetical protein
MKKQILFSEKQKFTQWWIWLILIGINATILVAIIIQVFGDMEFGNNPMSDLGLFMTSVLTSLLTIMFFNLRLETQMTEEGVFVKFFPFHTSFRFYSWEIIEKSYVRQYRPIGEFGGWGIRGLSKNRALNVSGNFGLQLELKENKRLLIGTQKPEEIKLVLIGLGK